MADRRPSDKDKADDQPKVDAMPKADEQPKASSTPPAPATPVVGQHQVQQNREHEDDLRRAEAQRAMRMEEDMRGNVPPPTGMMTEQAYAMSGQEQAQATLVQSQRMGEILLLRDRLERYETTLAQLAVTVSQNQAQLAEAKNMLQVIAQHEGVDLTAKTPA